MLWWFTAIQPGTKSAKWRLNGCPLSPVVCWNTDLDTSLRSMIWRYEDTVV